MASRKPTGSNPARSDGEPARKPARELTAALGEFLDYLRVERGSSPNTVEAYGRDLQRYLRFLAWRDVESVADVATRDVSAALQAVSDGGAATSTLSRNLASIRHFHRFCLREGTSPANPAALVDPPSRPSSIPKAMRMDDVESLIEAADDPSPAGLRDRAMLEVLYAGGVRVSELVGLDVDDIDLEGRVVRCLGKGDRERIVPIGVPAAEAAGLYLREGRPVLARAGRGTPAMFLNRRGGRLSRQTCWKVVKRHASRADLEVRAFPHALRHSFATHMVARGADLRVVQEALGHARLSTTQVYTLVTRERLRDVLDESHPRGSHRAPGSTKRAPDGE